METILDKVNFTNKTINLQNDLIKPPTEGSIVSGEIIGRVRSSVFVDLGPIGTGIIYGKEFLEAKDTLKKLKKGDKVFTKIINLDNDNGYIELSLTQAGRELTWQILKQSKEKGEVIEVKILGANKGGLLTEISQIPAFLPSSQLSSEYYPKVEDGDPAKILKELQKLVGKKIKVKILEISHKDEKIILSEKATRTEKIIDALSNYQVGDEVQGEIKDIVDFGAFVKFEKHPEIEGFIHISEIDWEIVGHPSEKLKVGQKVKMKITEIKGDKVFLSLKALLPDPWRGIENEYHKGDIIKGKVVKFNPFGAFVSIKPGVQGLIHISEFGSSKKMEEALKIGKEYKFKVSLFDPAQRKILLTLTNFGSDAKVENPKSKITNPKQLKSR